ncbi:3-methyl-2-oxobutanoate dehydrogenase subunit beta [Clostridium sp. PL3]|uniref:3-methyl-2-oxobutanoate dehydrogenase subunit beta n=1 Tax=Clostridium thailandense TaxID=2794346 RepID=A0A949U0S7_9CLOT|nr:3-methyl-2-oxobutanoate dehydrogenase subunit beta [Clostridium thailandense]MBV7274348.1 3-methyl-2-oxobutanoate dehydrogenase subunit beta [Clostridium thailandense]
MLEMIKGNNAIAEAAIRAGARLYAGYPITPSTEIMEYLSTRMKEVGGTFIQAESELAGINIVMGGAACGVRSFTASSGPGISLKQEGISAMSDENLACVVINVVRYGDGLGTLYSSQCDYLRETRGGGNGDYRTIVLCPESIQEAVDLIVLAFELAEKYRCVVTLMTEGALGQMMEPCNMPDFQTVKRQPWGLDGKYTNKKIGIFDRNSMEEAAAIKERHLEIARAEQRVEAGYLDDAEYVFVAYGLPGRSTKGAVEQLRRDGYKAGFIRPITAWPFPTDVFKQLNPDLKGLITVEANATGQLVEDVALTAKKVIVQNIPIYCLTYGYGIPAMKTIREDFEKIRLGQIKEVF